MVQAHTELVGQYAKYNAIKTYDRPLFIALCCLIGLVMLTGVLVGTSFGKPWWVTWSLVACLGTVYILMGFIFRLFDRLLGEAARRRIQLLRGGQAEAFVSVRLRDTLDDHWHLFDNVKPDPASDFDHVLIGPGGFFLISTKAKRGRFQSAAADPLMDCEPVDWARDAVRQAMRLRDLLPHYTDDPSATVPYLQALLCLPFAWIDTEQAHEGIDACGKCWVLHEDNLLDAIAPDPLPKSRRLKPADITRWAAAAEKLHQRHCSATAGQNP